MYQVSDTYQRFNQKYTMFSRILWDPSKCHLEPMRRENQLRYIERSVTGFSLKDYALADAASMVTNTLGTGINRANSGLTSWEPLPAYGYLTFPEEKPAVTDTALMTKQIKHVARYFGADLVGITKLDRRWLYSHTYITDTGEERPVEIDERYQYVIVMGLEQDYNLMQTAPSAVMYAEVLRKYSHMAYLVSAVADFIRRLGYHAIPTLNDTALNVPLAIDAGFGELGRMGVLLTPQYGPRQRLCKVITDLPLETDQPFQFGATEFCSVCHKCARECPAQAITYGEPTTESPTLSNNPGVLKWYLNPEKCIEYQRTVGTDCSVCLRACPFNKSKGLIHDMTRWLVQHAPAVDPLLTRMDDLVGYGKHRDPDAFWHAAK